MHYALCFMPPQPVDVPDAHHHDSPSPADHLTECSPSASRTGGCSASRVSSSGGRISKCTLSSCIREPAAVYKVHPPLDLPRSLLASLSHQPSYNSPSPRLTSPHCKPCIYEPSTPNHVSRSSETSSAHTPSASSPPPSHPPPSPSFRQLTSPGFSTSKMSPAKPSLVSSAATWPVRTPMARS